MDTLEFNKIAGSVLFTMLLIMGVGMLAEFLYTPPGLEKPAYVVELPESDDGDRGAATEVAEAEPLGVVLAAGDADKGATTAKKCAACHNFETGQPNKVGPNLHGVVGRSMATAGGFAYSTALKEMNASGDSWSYDKLFGFLEAPKKYVAGTTMAFAGLKKPTDRANVIAFLRSISPDAPPLPTVETEMPAGEAETPEAGGADANAGESSGH